MAMHSDSGFVCPPVCLTRASLARPCTRPRRSTWSTCPTPRFRVVRRCVPDAYCSHFNWSAVKMCQDNLTSSGTRPSGAAQDRFDGALQSDTVVPTSGDASDETMSEGLPQPQMETPRKALWKRILEEDAYDDLRVFGVSFVVALLFRILVVEPRYIPSLSMFPTFEIGDQLVVEKVSKLIRPYLPGDVVVFLPPPALIERGYGQNDAFIKRVVGAAGDTVKVTHGHIERNGVVQAEPFVVDSPSYEWGPAVIPRGYVMVLGDNRNNSYDSHVWGFLPVDHIIGRAIARYWPPRRVGSVILPPRSLESQDQNVPTRPLVHPDP